MAHQSPTSSSRRKRVSLVPEWRRAYRMASMRALLALATAVEVWSRLEPAQQDAVLSYLGLSETNAVLVGIALAAAGRLIRQESVRGSRGSV